MPVMVTVEDLATHLQHSVNRQPAEQILDLVEADVLTEYGSDTPPTATRPLQVLRQVILAAASRTYDNPKGIASETIGPYTYRREGGGMVLTDTERAAVRSVRTGAISGGIASVSLTTPHDVAASEVWWSV